MDEDDASWTDELYPILSPFSGAIDSANTWLDSTSIADSITSSTEGVLGFTSSDQAIPIWMWGVGIVIALILVAYIIREVAG